MTPTRKKAIQLINDFQGLYPMFDSHRFTYGQAKKCAIRTCEFMISNASFINAESKTIKGLNERKEFLDYWNNVKSELNKI